MAVNGFEQLFINLTNERIQHLFNGVMFERELEAYRQEGITAAFDPGVSNLECVRLFTSPSNPPGIVRLLGESALMKSGRDGAALVQVLNSSFARHPSYKVCDPQDAQRAAKAKGLRAGGRGGLGLDYRECFQVRHYAGTVMYTVSGWVPKSVDALLPHLAEVLCASGKPGVRELFEREDAAGKATVGEKFCGQLEALADTLEQGETLFVRCIKSNPQMVPGLVDRPLVLEQLVHGGVISALEMRRRGLPERMEYRAFCAEYGMLEAAGCPARDDRARCGALLRSVFGDEAEQLGHFALGHTKVFLKGHVHAFIRALASLRVRNLAKRLQRQWRLHMGTERIRKVEEAWQHFQASESLAAARGIESLPSVALALQEGAGRIGPVVQLLRDARCSHGADVQRVAAALPPELVRPLFGTAEAVCVLVERVSQRKAAAEELLGLRMARAMDSVLRLLGRVEAVERECRDVAEAVDAAELGSCTEACGAARERLEALRAEELPVLKRLGPVAVDLEGTEELQPEAAGPPGLGELLERAAQLVARAELLGHEVLRVRRAFQEAVEEFQDQQAAAQSALEALQEPARRCVAEGLNGIVESVDVAWRRQAEAQEVLQAARDASAYRAAVEAFVRAVREAEAAVERGREELAKREAEKEERRALQAQLDVLQQQLQERRALWRRNLEVRLGTPPARSPATADVEGLLEEIPVLRGQAQAGLEAWRARIEAVARRTAAVLAAADSQLSQATKARQEEFARRVSMFSQSPEQRGTESTAADPVAFLRAEGLASHEGPLLELLEAIRAIQMAGAPRSSLQRCLSHWVRCAYGGAAALQFSPSRG